MVPVLFVSVVYLNFSARTTDLIRNRERKVLCIYRQLLNSTSVLFGAEKGQFTRDE